MRDGRERAVVIAGSAPEPVPPTVDGERRREHDLGDVTQRRGDRGTRRLAEPAVSHRQRRPRLVRRPLQIAFRDAWQQDLDVAAPQLVEQQLRRRLVSDRRVGGDRLGIADRGHPALGQRNSRCFDVRRAAPGSGIAEPRSQRTLVLHGMRASHRERQERPAQPAPNVGDGRGGGRVRMTLRLRLSLAFLVIVVAPLVATAVIVGRGVPHALNTSAANRLTAAEAAASSWVQQTCVQVRLAAEVLARETAALTGPSRESAAADIVDRHLADYAVVTSPSGAIITQSGSLNGASPAFADLKPCSAASPSTAGAAAIADGVDVRSTGGSSLGRAVAAISLDPKAAQRIAQAIDAQVTLAVVTNTGRTTVGDRLTAPVAVPGSRVSIV